MKKKRRGGVAESSGLLIARRPGVICCPECGDFCDYQKRGGVYACVRCLINWGWYCTTGMHDDIEIRQVHLDNG
jgi:hypothetical protein